MGLFTWLTWRFIGVLFLCVVWGGAGFLVFRNTSADAWDRNKGYEELWIGFVLGSIVLGVLVLIGGLVFNGSAVLLGLIGLCAGIAPAAKLMSLQKEEEEN